MLSRLKIGPKLLLAPGVVLLLLVLLSSGAYYAMLRQHASLQTIVGPRADQMRSAAGLAEQAQRVHADTYKLLTWLGSSFSGSRIDALAAGVTRQHEDIERSFSALSRLTPAGSLERRHVDQAVIAHRAYVAAAREVVELAQADETIGANAMIKPEAAFSRMTQRMAMLAALERTLSEEASSSAAADFRLTAVLMPVVILLAVAVSLAITMAVRRVLLRDIQAIGAAALGLAKGDLTIREHNYGGDEIGETSRALDAGIRNLSGTLRTVLDSARTIGSASRDIALGSLSTQGRALYRQRALRETTDALRALSERAHSSADDAGAADGLARTAAHSAYFGKTNVDAIAASMAAVKEDALRAAEVAAVIDAIAGEAGTLALNAGLGAARGGEEGREFADAAAQVRELARRAASAAREVRELAGRSVQEIDRCTGSALAAGSSLAQVAGSVRAVEDIVGRIRRDSQGQHARLREVDGAIVRMDEVTQRNSVLVEEAAAAARTLQTHALALSRTVASFRLDEAEVKVPVKPRPMREEKKESDVARDLPRERRRHERAHLRLASSRK